MRAWFFVALGAGLVGHELQAAEDVDWGAWRVKVEERWPGAEAGWDWGKIPAGVGLWRMQGPMYTAMEDYKLGWMAAGDEGYGVAGLLQGELGMEERVEVRQFGRRGNTIQLMMVVHSKGGVLPETVKGVVRRKLKLAEGSQAPVTFENAGAVKLGGKKILFTGGFPDDLPIGEYQVVVELHDAVGAVRQRYEKRLIRNKKELHSLAKLTDDELLREYVKRGEALKGSSAEPIDWRSGRGAAMFEYNSPPCSAWNQTRQEIIRRGGAIVPALMKMLESEAVRNPGEATLETAKFGFAFDLMRMLASINDPRPVDLLVRLMGGMDGKVNLAVREQAVKTAEMLTRVVFVVERDNPVSGCAMMGEEALIVSWRARNRESEFKTVTGLYGKWLGNDGRDRTAWLRLARERARKALEGNDPIAVRNAVTFLTGGFPRGGYDDAPEETVRAIAKIMARGDRLVVEENKHFIHFPTALAGYGPPARPHVQSMIDQAKTRATWDSFANLAGVGGEEAVAHMVQTLPELRKKVEGSGISIEVNEHQISDMEARQAVLAYRACRWGIERWAGRTFDSDEKVFTWWETAKGKSQRQWLEESLARTLAQADGGSAKAQHIARGVLPDLPHAAEDRPFDPPWQERDGTIYQEKDPGAYREQWLAKNRAKLAYDERRSCYVRAGLHTRPSGG